MGDPRKDGGDRAPAVPSIGPVRRFGRYTLVKKLATGGMAEIWLARQKGLAGFNRFVVIKKILSHLSEQETFVRMFLDEARTSALLNHPNVVQIYDLGREGESYYIAMEFIAGENLAAIAWRGMKRGNPLSPSFAARIIADTCKALHYAHHLHGSDGQALDIVHRDISPQNILVTYEGEIKVVDFGIAKAATKSEHTKTGMLKGKFSYMSPEQCLGTPVDMRSDIFALGILLYELCTGKRLFKHESELMILEMITKRSVVAPSQVAPGVSPRLEEVIMTALEKPADARFQTAQDMQIALEDFLREEDRPATNAEIAVYMRALFEDKIEEKRLLREAASRDDFESTFGDEGPTEQSLRTRSGANPHRRTVQGLPPSQLHAAQPGASGPYLGGHPPGMLAHLPPGAIAAMTRSGTPNPITGGQTPVGYLGGAYPGTPGSMPYPGPGASYPNTVTLPETQSWIPRLVIAGALVVILAASAILYQQLMHEPTQTISPQPSFTPPAQARTGKLVLDSMPNGAAIFLDGKPMTLDNGEQARTPSDLTSLQYGTTYNIRLIKDGHEPHDQALVMSALTDGQSIKPRLHAHPGKIVAEVTGPNAHGVRVFFSGNDAGLGPKIVSGDLEAHEAVVVTAALAGMTCNAEPARLRIIPDSTVRTTIRCEPAKNTSDERGASRGSSRSQDGSGVRTSRRTDEERDRVPRGDRERDRDRDRVEKDPETSGGDAGSRSGAAGSGACKSNPSLPQGFITLNTTPYSDIFIGGRKIGQTPISKYKVPSGCVEVKAVTSDGTFVTQKLEVEPNKVRIYKFDVK